MGTNHNVYGIDGSNIPAGDQINSIAQGYVTTAGAPGGPLNSAKAVARDYLGVVNGQWDIIPTLTLSTAVCDTAELQKIDSAAFLAGTQKEFHSVTSNEALTCKPDPRYTIYASAANGEKSGGFNGGAAGPADLTFNPETDWGYEGGIKTSLLDGHLRADADIFHQDISNLQVLGPPSTAGSVALVVKNYGALSETGFELSGNWASATREPVDTFPEIGRLRVFCRQVERKIAGIRRCQALQADRRQALERAQTAARAGRNERAGSGIVGVVTARIEARLGKFDAGHDALEKRKVCLLPRASS